jgi:phosphonatase-like hydrolase
MQLPKLVVFDMAGTTVEDRGEVPAAFEAALAEHDIHVTPEQVNAVRGASKRQAIRQLIPDGPDRDTRVERAYTSFKEQVAQRFKNGVQPVPGAETTFAWLRERGVQVALNTGFDRDITTLLVSALHWDQGQVDAVVCGDDVSRGRPAPQLIFRCMEALGTTSVHDVAVVGDTTLDLQAGHNAGARWSIGVLSGAHNREQLQEQPHTQLLASVAELPLVFADVPPAKRVIPASAAKEERFDWGTLKWLCNASLVPGANQTLGICQIDPGQRNPVHVHPNCEEVLYMLSGTGMHRLDDQLVQLSAGDSIHIPMGVKHNLQNTGHEPIRCVIAFSSGRRQTVFLE